MGKKVLICCNAYPPNFIGGAELMAHYHAKQLQKLGYEVLIFTGDTKIHDPRHSIRKEKFDGLPVYRIYLTHEDYDPQFINFTHADIEDYFKKILSEFSPDVVHFHNIIGLSVGLIHIAKQRGLKTVLTLHDHWGFCFKNTLIKNNNEICQDYTKCRGCMEVFSYVNFRNVHIRMRRDFLAMQFEDIDAFISPSQYLANTYIRAGIPKEKMHVIWNGIDVQKYSKIDKIPDNDHIRFAFIGYFGKHKGIHVIFDALQYISNKEKISINLIGDGELFAQYKKEIRDKKLDKVVKFWGKIKNIEDAYAQTDVFILPSIWPENQPVSITEAMSAGIPVIASDIGGIPELVEDGKTGFLFERGNSLDLAKKMNEFISVPEKIRSLGINAYEKMKNNTLQNQVSQIIRIYNESSRHAGEHKRNQFLIACMGNSSLLESARMLDLISHASGENTIRLVMYDWLQEDQKKTIHLVWIIDPASGIQQVIDPIKNKLCLLVPEKSAELKEICTNENCGLYYRNLTEILACIDYLILHGKERENMGWNGYKYYLKYLHECVQGTIRT